MKITTDARMEMMAVKPGIMRAAVAAPVLPLLVLPIADLSFPLWPFEVAKTCSSTVAVFICGIVD